MLHEGNVVLVTGGATGIGRAASIIFAREGAKVAIADIAVESALETVSIIEGNGGEAIFVHADMLDPDSIRNMVAKTVQHFGQLNAALNNAGHSGNNTDAVECDLSEWDAVINLNMRAVWLCMKYEIPELIKAGGGAIVNTASGMANFAAPKWMAYAASKAGVLGLTRSAAVDFGPLGIRVNALLPGSTKTGLLQAALDGGPGLIAPSVERIPLRRFAEPEEPAELAVWLASDRASFVTGEQIVADGGMTALR